MPEIVYAVASVTPELVEASAIPIFDAVGAMLVRHIRDEGATPGPVLGIVEAGAWSDAGGWIEWLDCYAVSVDG